MDSKIAKSSSFIAFMSFSIVCLLALGTGPVLVRLLEWIQGCRRECFFLLGGYLMGCFRIVVTMGEEQRFIWWVGLLCRWLSGY